MYLCIHIFICVCKYIYIYRLCIYGHLSKERMGYTWDTLWQTVAFLWNITMCIGKTHYFLRGNALSSAQIAGACRVCVHYVAASRTYIIHTVYG